MARSKHKEPKSRTKGAAFAWYTSPKFKTVFSAKKRKK